jgi:L-amino acid N-acyltransferase YncA
MVLSKGEGAPMPAIRGATEAGLPRITQARQRGVHVMVGAIEAASVALHKWAGFEEAGVLREVGRKFDRWLDLLFARKILACPLACP